MINPDVVEGQIAGGVVQGIGGVLYEHMVYDDAGNPLSTTFVDYLLPTAAEVPTIEYGHIETPASTNPGGYKGMGEGGAIGSPPAVINAVADAVAHLGARLTRQPLTPMAVLAAVRAASPRVRLTRLEESTVSERNRQTAAPRAPDRTRSAPSTSSWSSATCRRPATARCCCARTWLSFDPAQRGWLNDVRSYVPPVAIGEPMRAYGIGEVVTSNVDGVAARRPRPRPGRLAGLRRVDPADDELFEPVPADVDAAAR